MTNPEATPSKPEPAFLEVGEPPGRRRIAVRAREGASPGLFWLGGFHSDMQGTKAIALDQWAAEHGRACVRFDYSGHGGSGGDFRNGTISRWLDEAAADTTAPVVVLSIAAAFAFTTELERAVAAAPDWGVNGLARITAVKNGLEGTVVDAVAQPASSIARRTSTANRPMPARARSISTRNEPAWRIILRCQLRKGSSRGIRTGTQAAKALALPSAAWAP